MITFFISAQWLENESITAVSLYAYYHTVPTLFLKPANAALVQPAYPVKSTNQTAVSAKSTNQTAVSAKSTNQTSLSTPIAPSNSSALVKPPSSSGVSDSDYSDWSPWSKCSATCGHQAVMHRERTCKLIGGKPCQGSNTQTKPCQFLRCPGILKKKLEAYLGRALLGIGELRETDVFPYICQSF